MGAAAASGDHDVDAVGSANDRHHLVVVVGVHEAGPEMPAVGIALGRAAVPERPDRLPGVLEKKLADVRLAPAVLAEELSMLRADDHECVAHDVHLDVA